MVGTVGSVCVLVAVAATVYAVVKITQLENVKAMDKQEALEEAMDHFGA